MEILQYLLDAPSYSSHHEEHVPNVGPLVSQNRKYGILTSIADDYVSTIAFNEHPDEWAAFQLFEDFPGFHLNLHGSPSNDILVRNYFSVYALRKVRTDCETLRS